MAILLISFLHVIIELQEKDYPMAILSLSNDPL